ncbi:MAG: hypothetical protein M3Z54_14200 [Gemmatimonadota bacterium]|nr:hypothetical protein [Gemmatimonadota bacterium]
MTARFLQNMKLFAGVALLGAIAACSGDLTGSNMHPVKLSVTSSVLSAPASTSAMRSSLAVGSAGNFTITKVQLVMDKIELNDGEATNCVNEIETAGDDHAEVGTECEDVSRDPVLVDIPVDGTLKTALNVPLAAGSYSKLEAKLEPARESATAFNAANASLAGKSVRVEGTYGSAATPFVFTSSVRAGLEMSFNPPLVIDATTTNATVSIDVSKWFLDSSNNVIDPNSATPGSGALQTIEDNIRRSFHAFEDDHESGIDDHSGHR